VGTGNVSVQFESNFPVYHYGITYTNTGTSGAGVIFTMATYKTNFFDTCQFFLNTSTSGVKFTNNTAGGVVLKTQPCTWRDLAIDWRVEHQLFIRYCLAGWLDNRRHGSSYLFQPQGSNFMSATLRGVDLSPITGTLVQTQTTGAGNKYLFDSCRIASGVTRLSATNMTNTRETVELVNCYDGTNIINESYQPAGAVTTERTITMTGGATDDVGTLLAQAGEQYEHRQVRPTVARFLDGLRIPDDRQQQDGDGGDHQRASLNNDEISLLLEYQGTSGSPVASIATTLPATVLTAASAVTTSTATWNSSPATPVKQHLQVTFTPQVAGRVRGQVRLGKASTTCYYDPVITIT
jgi:hypothetical protein